MKSPASHPFSREKTGKHSFPLRPLRSFSFIRVNPWPKFLQNGKGQLPLGNWPLFNAGNDLLSHTLSRAGRGPRRARLWRAGVEINRPGEA